jgi:hypothetical protein
MTVEDFKALRGMQNHRVRMTFADGQELIATLFSVTTDLDESRHVIYEKLEWSVLPHPDLRDGLYYSAGEELVSCFAIQA